MTAAIVSGHTRGLGAALATELLRREITVLGLARGSNAALAAEFPAQFEQVALDLADSAALAQWIAGPTLQRFVAGHERVLLANVAGTLQPIGPPELLDARAIATAVALNIAAPLMLVSALTTASSANSERRIMHISSGAARKPYVGWSVYCASKAALDHHARALALEERADLRVCAMAPGVLDTDMQAEIRACTLEQFPLRDRFAEMQRAGGLTDPAQAARQLADYILSDGFGAEATGDLRDLPR